MEHLKVHVYASFQVEMWKKEMKKVLEGDIGDLGV